MKINTVLRQLQQSKILLLLLIFNLMEMPSAPAWHWQIFWRRIRAKSHPLLPGQGAFCIEFLHGYNKFIEF
jgi:hypothetical protein